jgi:hypothetical protein
MLMNGNETRLRRCFKRHPYLAPAIPVAALIIALGWKRLSGWFIGEKFPGARIGDHHSFDAVLLAHLPPPMQMAGLPLKKKVNPLRSRVVKAFRL